MTELDQNRLTLAFLEREPRSAALVLEEIPAVDAAAFLDGSPARLTAPVISAMIPWSAARCIENMGAEQASGLMRSLDYSDAVSILRLVDKNVQDRILNLATKRFARSFRTSLIYPKDTVGAWMDVAVPSFQETTRIRDAVRAIKRMPRSHTHIFLVNSAKEFSGLVQLGDLYRHDENAALADIADRTLKPLSNRDTLQAGRARTEWDRLTLLPVVGRKQNFLGGLSRAGLRKALLDQDFVIQIATPGSVLMQLLSAFIAVATAFANMTLLADNNAAQAQTREKPRGRKRTKRNK